MMKFRLSQCPYCGKKLNPFHSWYLKTQGEYLCPKCGGISNIIMDPFVYILGCAALVIALIGFLITRISGDIFSLSVLWWIVVPFFLFSVLCAFLVRLKKPILRKKAPGDKKGAKRKGQTIRGMNIQGMQYVPGGQQANGSQAPQAQQRPAAPAQAAQAAQRDMQKTQQISFDLPQAKPAPHAPQVYEAPKAPMADYLAEDPYAAYAKAAPAKEQDNRNDRTVQFDLPKDSDDIWQQYK